MTTADRHHDRPVPYLPTDPTHTADALIDAVRAALVTIPTADLAQYNHIPAVDLAILADAMRVYAAELHGQPRVWLACHLAVDFRAAVAADLVARYALTEAVADVFGPGEHFMIHGHQGLYTSISWTR